MFRSADHNHNTTVGDIVLISQLKRPEGHLITHEITEIIYKNGALVDPISGKLCHGRDYAEDIINSNLEEYRKQSTESEV